MGTLVCLLLGLAPAAALPELRVGMEVRHAPWAYLPGQEDALVDISVPPEVSPSALQRVQGFDVDVMRALARHLRVRPRIVPTAWPDLEVGLLAGRFDIILSAWTPRPDTPEDITATTAYHDWGLLMVVRQDDPRVRTVADLDGLIVGHYRDPAVEKPLQAMGHGTYQVADSSAALFRQLKAGTVDAVIFDSLYVRWRVSRDPALRIVGEPLNRLGYHVGVSRANTALLSRVQRAVAALVGSPELLAIRQEWEEAPRAVRRGRAVIPPRAQRAIRPLPE
jgi:ABC-type amino acid transport substrate-binding protein